MMTPMSTTSNHQTLIFVYGTLKRGHGNHYLIEQFLPTNDAVFLGPHKTVKPFPLVCGPLGVPFLINYPGSGQRVLGELYSVSGPALARLDELEGISCGHYERLPIELVAAEEDTAAVVEAEGYFVHRSFAEDMWRKSGRVGMEEYTEKDGEKYVRIKDRAEGLSLKDYIINFLQDQDDAVVHHH